MQYDEPERLEPDYYIPNSPAWWAASKTPGRQPVMPDDHSAVEPPLPISNRTVKRCSADDSEPALVKVGHCQASKRKTPTGDPAGVFLCPLDMG